ncbi:hypothetical protein Slin_1339 [Spirosoma linguale DSM 74]|uniref:Uncharacterized protein n=1 Tax=Spirosoma linguale (strain ATCC 33905 / DSM 74 / LMG 10896 / Claus 1) TaxID=504472 RepID=D2QM33_SPILD|nr:hypothetical protein Slin_1339 [Spirosoma linguale DSM 74]
MHCQNNDLTKSAAETTISTAISATPNLIKKLIPNRKTINANKAMLIELINRLPFFDLVGVGELKSYFIID